MWRKAVYEALQGHPALAEPFDVSMHGHDRAFEFRAARRLVLSRHLHACVHAGDSRLVAASSASLAIGLDTEVSS